MLLDTTMKYYWQVWFLKRKTVRNSSSMSEAADALCVGVAGIGTAVHIEVT